MEENLKQQATSTIKIAIYGPESTGKTTIAKQLAEHFETVWTPEFARDFLQEKFNDSGIICQPEDLMPIAEGQIKLENDTLSTANKFLFCDTCLLVTKVYSEIYYNYCDPILDAAAKEHQYDLFFLTDIDIPWEKDDLRDRPDDRESIFKIFKDALINTNKPFITLSGNIENRLKQAIICVKNLVKCRELGLSSIDFVQIYNHEIDIEQINTQLQIFKSGAQKIILDRAATRNDGIVKLSEDEFNSFADYFESQKSSLKLKKFVPASGAASRMFKFLSEFLNDFDVEEETVNAYVNRKHCSDLTVFIAGLEKFPFFSEVDQILNKMYPDFKSWPRDLKNYNFVKVLLNSEYLNFCEKPKGILPFHKYVGHIATPIEEHLEESANYASSNGFSHLHFTISEKHQKHFEFIINRVKGNIEKKSKSKIEINYSYQAKQTDTIAVNPDNTPFRNANGTLLFRPGGHGALIENLNNLDADIIFIKNIDNVIQDQIEKISIYKKGLAGILIQLQKVIHDNLKKIESRQFSKNDISAITEFAESKLNIKISADFQKYTLENKIDYLRDKLDRPIRVCGMVKNEGEPGGGPFWTKDQNGNLSLQIVESSQIDLSNTEQMKIMASATHFNPVDLVCGMKNFKSENYDLHNFIDHDSGFIAQKNKNGKDLKAYELPGLWNGAMAKWITIFVEVPLQTFNPVKTVNDLLKAAHQPQ